MDVLSLSARLVLWVIPVMLAVSVHEVVHGIVAGVAGKVIWPMMVLGMAVATELAGVPVGQVTHALGMMLGVET